MGVATGAVVTCVGVAGQRLARARRQDLVERAARGRHSCHTVGGRTTSSERLRPATKHGQQRRANRPHAPRLPSPARSHRSNGADRSDISTAVAAFEPGSFGRVALWRGRGTCASEVARATGPFQAAAPSGAWPGCLKVLSGSRPPLSGATPSSGRQGGSVIPAGSCGACLATAAATARITSPFPPSA